MRLATYSIVIGLALIACRSKKAEPAREAEKPAASAPAVQASATPAAPEPEPEPPELPTESDYEQEVTERITGSNLERELDKLEKELLGR
jgi:hypothetical protein